MPDDPVTIVLVIVLLVVSLGVHEAAHGWVALKCGDTTARDMGRITLNPIPHIDLFMTIVLPLVLYLGGGPIFGGAKPVPVAFHRLRHPWRDMSLVAIAGPFSNFLLAILFALFYKLAVDVFGMQPVRSFQTYQVLPMVMYQSIRFNLLLAAFNLIPIPPLDGSRILAWILPENIRPAYVQIERFGMLIIFGLLYFRLLWRIIGPIMDVLFEWVFAIVTVGGLW